MSEDHPAYQTLMALQALADAAANNDANSAGAKTVAYDLYLALDDQLEALDQAAIHQTTIELKAAAADMKPGLDALAAFKTRIEAVANGLREATAIVTGIDNYLCEAKTFFGIA